MQVYVFHKIVFRVLVERIPHAGQLQFKKFSLLHWHVQPRATQIPQPPHFTKFPKFFRGFPSNFGRAVFRSSGWWRPNDTYWAEACEPTEYVTTGGSDSTTPQLCLLSGGLWRPANLCTSGHQVILDVLLEYATALSYTCTYKLGAPRGQRFPITGICKLRVTWMAQWLTHRAICSHFNSSTHGTRTWCIHRRMYKHTVGRHVDAECSQGVRNLRVVELICSRNVLKCTRKSPLPTNFCLQQLIREGSLLGIICVCVNGKYYMDWPELDRFISDEFFSSS